MAITKTTARQFATEQRGYGLTGMRLDLSLLQCQHLRAVSEAIKRKVDFDETGAVIILNESVINDIVSLNPFFALFEGFASPDISSLWNNGSSDEVK